MRPLFILLILIFSISFNVIAEEKLNKSIYKFGVFPYLSAIRMDRIYSPVADELSKNLEREVKFRTSSTFKKFLNKLKSEYYDFALIQPFWYPIAVDSHNYLPLLRMEEPFVSLIMVIDNSNIHTVDDLKGKVIATPPAFVPVVHMARQALIKQGIVPGKDVIFKAFKTVDSCFQQVLIGKASACVTPPFAPKVIEQSMNVKLRTVLKSPSIPNLSFVIHSRVSKADRERIHKEMSSWNKTIKGKKLLGKIKTNKFIPIVDKEYDVIRDFIKEIRK